MAEARTIVCGDIHLRPSAEGAFFLFLDELRAELPGRLIILGDLFEYWIDTAVHVRRHQPLFGRIAALVEAGWRVDLVLGNRELAADKRLYRAAPWQVHWPVLDIPIENAEPVRIVHGDRMMRDPGYHLLAATVRSWWFWGWRNSMPDPLQLFIAEGLRRRSRAKQRRTAEMGAPPDLIDPRRVRWTARGAARVLAGHVHEQWRKPVGGVDLTLCGHWEHDQARWVEIDANGEPHLHEKVYENTSAPPA